VNQPGARIKTTSLNSICQHMWLLYYWHFTTCSPC